MIQNAFIPLNIIGVVDDLRFVFVFIVLVFPGFPFAAWPQDGQPPVVQAPQPGNLVTFK